MNLIEKAQELFNEMTTYPQYYTACRDIETALLDNFRNRKNEPLVMPKTTPEEIRKSGEEAVQDFKDSRRPEAATTLFNNSQVAETPLNNPEVPVNPNVVKETDEQDLSK